MWREEFYKNAASNLRETASRLTAGIREAQDGAGAGDIVSRVSSGKFFVLSFSARGPTGISAAWSRAIGSCLSFQPSESAEGAMERFAKWRKRWRKRRYARWRRGAKTSFARWRERRYGAFCKEVWTLATGSQLHVRVTKLRLS